MLDDPPNMIDPINYVLLFCSIPLFKSFHVACRDNYVLKGDFFYLFKVFIGPKLRQVSIGNFHRKAPKWVKNQAKGSKIHKIRTKWLPTYCGNPSILASDLLWESIFYKFGFRPTVGIHQFWLPTYCGNPSILSSDLLWESINSVLRATVGIHLYTRVDSHSSSEDRIGGFPQ